MLQSRRENTLAAAFVDLVLCDACLQHVDDVLLQFSSVIILYCVSRKQSEIVCVKFRHTLIRNQSCDKNTIMAYSNVGRIIIKLNFNE